MGDAERRISFESREKEDYRALFGLDEGLTQLLAAAAQKQKHPDENAGRAMGQGPVNRGVGLQYTTPERNRQGQRASREEEGSVCSAGSLHSFATSSRYSGPNWRPCPSPEGGVLLPFHNRLPSPRPFQALRGMRHHVHPHELDPEVQYSVEWVQDESASACHVCDRRFSYTRRRHHCRACGQVVCKRCSMDRRRVPGLKGLQRTCVQCVRKGNHTPATAASTPATVSSTQPSSPHQALMLVEDEMGLEDATSPHEGDATAAQDDATIAEADVTPPRADVASALQEEEEAMRNQQESLRSRHGRAGDQQEEEEEEALEPVVGTPGAQAMGGPADTPSARPMVSQLEQGDESALPPLASAAVVGLEHETPGGPIPPPLAEGEDGADTASESEARRDSVEELAAVVAELRAKVGLDKLEDELARRRNERDRRRKASTPLARFFQVALPSIAAAMTAAAFYTLRPRLMR